VLLKPNIDYVQRFATREAADSADKDGKAEEDDEDVEMSDIGSISEGDD
jgi:ubiquitin-conjugating enzyme E2 H